jgi:hypothetical protein
MKKLVKFVIAILPIFIIGHFTQSWPFVYGGLVQIAVIAIVFNKEVKRLITSN